MKLMTATVFAIGYVLGARAGHERYEQSASWRITPQRTSMPLVPDTGLRPWSAS